MSDWPQLERQLVGSARRRSRRRRGRRLIALVPVAAALALVMVMLARSPQATTIPNDERPALSGTATAVPPADSGLARVDVSQYGPIDARVLVDSLSDRYRRVTIDKGTADGVHRGDPVIDGAGLVGKVEDTSGGSSVVTLITDQSFATSVYAGQRRHVGSITPAIAAPGELLFEPVDVSVKVRQDEPIYTTGTTDAALESRYPPAIPVGWVSRIDLGNGDLDRRVYVRPAVDFDRLDRVQVLSEPHGDPKAK